MAPPGSIEARYQRLAGDEDTRLELYIARRRLGFSIEEWQALPWWHRRVYLEGLNNEAQANQPEPGQTAGDGDPWDAVLSGGDVTAAGFGT